MDLLVVVVACGHVQAGQHGAHLGAVVQVGRQPVAAVQPRQQRGGLALERELQRTCRVGLRVGHRDAARRQVLHQAQVVGQFGRLEALEQRQHVAAVPGAPFGVDEPVAVLDAAADALEARQPAQIQSGHERADIVLRDGGVDGHGGLRS